MQPDNGHFETYGDAPTVPLIDSDELLIDEPEEPRARDEPMWYRRGNDPRPEPPDFLAMSERALARIAGRPRPAAQPAKWSIGRLLRRCAGADETLLAWVPQERPRYTGMGGAVLLTSVLAVVSSTVALSIAFHVRGRWLVPLALLGLLWGALIFNLDRWIVASPMPRRVWQKAPTIIVRLLMALAFGVVIAEPLVLTVFSSAVSAEYRQEYSQARAVRQSTWDSCNPVPPTSPPPAGVNCADFRLALADTVGAADQKLRNAQAQLAVAQQNFTAVRTQYEKMQDAAASDCTGADGHYGDGPVCEGLKNAAAQYWSSNNGDQLQQTVNNAQREVDTDSVALKTAQDGFAQARTKAIQQQVDSWKPPVPPDPGLLERIKALQTLAASTGVLAAAIWCVRGLLILVDLAPALTKFTSGTTSYDRLVVENLRLGETRNRAQRQTDEEEADDWVDEWREETRLTRARHRSAREADIDELLDFLAWRQARDLDGPRPFNTTARRLVPQVQPVGVMGPPPLPRATATNGPRPAAVEPSPPAARRDTDDIWPEVGTWRPLNVVTLGGPGVGKTNLMAAMFARLQTRDDRRGYHLLCGDARQYDDLSRIADALQRPGTDWPELPQGPLRRYEFVCMVPVGREEYPVLRVCYWDCPGEVLTGREDDHGPLGRELSKRLAEAHAVIIAVDGVELRAAEFDPVRRDALEEILERSVVWAGTSRCPVQIVVTKWDFVGRQPDAGGVVWTRQRAVEALAGYPCMAGLFTTHRHRADGDYQRPGPRVVPVSVLGDAGCAVDDGAAVRRLYPAAPVNVDVPFAGILPDRLAQYFDGLSTAALEKRLRHPNRGAAAGMARVGLRAASLALNVLKLVLPVSGAATAVMDRLAGLDPGSWIAPYVLDKGAGERSDRADRALIRDARRRRDAAGRFDVAKCDVLAGFSRRLATFDSEYPAPGQ